MTNLHHHAADIAAQAVSGSITAKGAQGRLNQAVAPLLPALRLIAAREHARQIKSFVNADRVDIEVTAYLSTGEMLTITTMKGAAHGQP